MKKATKNGTCQVCGNVQAVRGGDNGYALAKHGYTVDWGFFSGTCRGSDIHALELSRELLDVTVGDCLSESARLGVITADDVTTVELDFADPESRQGDRRPRITRTLTRTQFDALTDSERQEKYLLGGKWADGEWTKAVAYKVRTIHALADRYAAAAESLTKLAEDRYDQPLYPRDNGIERKRLDGPFRLYAEAVDAAAELKSEGWKTRIVGGRYSRNGDALHVTATRKRA